MIVDLVRACVQYGDFTLASGKKSSVYVNLRPLLMSSRGIAEVGRMVAHVMLKLGVTVIGGPETAAIPIVAAALRELPDGRGFWVRKEPKGHGMGKLVEGDLRRGDRFLIVDDVVTTGQSLIRASEIAARECGATCVGAACVLNREEGCSITLNSLVKMNQVTGPQILVHGRHAGSMTPEFRATVTREEEFLRVRVEDENNPDFWLEVIQR